MRRVSLHSMFNSFSTFEPSKNGLKFISTKQNCLQWETSLSYINHQPSLHHSKVKPGCYRGWSHLSCLCDLLASRRPVTKFKGLPAKQKAKKNDIHCIYHKYQHCVNILVSLCQYHIIIVHVLHCTTTISTNND